MIDHLSPDYPPMQREDFPSDRAVDIYEGVLAMLRREGVTHRLLHHPGVQTKTSAESAAIRRQLGAPAETIGAKALYVKQLRGKQEEFNLLVVPSLRKANIDLFEQEVPGLKHHRFATKEEVAAKLGLVSGCIPPFGAPFVQGIDHLYVDVALRDALVVGFNIASLVRSCLLAAKDYVRLAQPRAFVPMSSEE